MRRLLGLVVCLLLVATVAAVSSAIPPSALLFRFEPKTASPSDVVSIRMTTVGREREQALQRPIRLYLAPKDLAAKVRSRFDPRLHYIGSMARSSRGALRFTVPPLDSADYVAAAWCPGCALSPGARSFSVIPLGPNPSPRYRAFWLRVHMPSAADTCPVSGEGTYGNGLLSTWLPDDGVLVARRDPDGTLFDKLGWLPREGFTGVLTVRGERLDAPSPPMNVLAVNWGYSYPSGRGSWASAVKFPSEGCWRISGRVRDVSLSYVVKVVGG